MIPETTKLPSKSLLNILFTAMTGEDDILGEEKADNFADDPTDLKESFDKDDDPWSEKPAEESDFNEDNLGEF